MSLETQSRKYLDTLRELGGKAGNQRLLNELGWAESTYQRVKDHLTAEGAIVPGRGRGGSVALAQASDGEKPSVSRLGGKAHRSSNAAESGVERGRSRNGGLGDYSQAFNAIDKAMRTGEGTTIWYLRVIHHLAQNGDVWTLDIAGEEWGEVDFPEDVAGAEALAKRWDEARKAKAA